LRLWKTKVRDSLSVSSSRPIGRRLNRLFAVQQLRRVVFYVAHVLADLEGLHFVGGERAEQIDRWLVSDLTIEPPVEVAGVHDDGHAVVNRCHQLIRVSGDDREALQPLAIRRVFPCVPQAREGEHIAAGQVEGEGLFVLRIELLPFVEAGSWYQAPALLEWLTVGGRVGDRLGAGIDRRNALHIGGLLGEKRNEASTELHEFALAGIAIGADDRLHGGRRYVVVPWRQREVIDLGSVEGLGDFLLVGASVVAATHRDRV
jgi:hypothetical protein